MKNILKAISWFLDAVCLPAGIIIIGFALASIFTGYTVPLWFGGVSYSPYLDLAFGCYLVYLALNKD